MQFFLLECTTSRCLIFETRMSLLISLFSVAVIILREQLPILLLEEENFVDTWKAIPNYLLDKFGGLILLLRCNYD